MRRIGERIVTVLAEVGLSPHWSGSGAEAIALPGFVWRRRFTPERGLRDLRTPGELDVAPLIAQVKVELSAGLALGDVDFGERFDDFYGVAGSLFDLSAQHRSYVEAIEAFAAAEQAAEAGWNSPTDNDRLDAALRELSRAGVHTGAPVGTTLDDGWAYVGMTCEPSQHGAVFFHRQDVLWCLRGEGLHLAFGAWHGGALDPQRSVELAHTLCDALRSVGLEPSWDGTYAHRVHLPGFTWQRRRWTEPPALSPSPPRRGLLSRLFQRRPVGVDHVPALYRATRPDIVEPHLAHVDASAFDLPLAERMREKGARLGLVRAHAASFGKPLCFLRAGETAWFLPRAGGENLPAALVGRNHVRMAEALR